MGLQLGTLTEGTNEKGLQNLQALELVGESWRVRTADHFGEISFYQALPSSPMTNSTIEQHAQSAKRKTAAPTPEDARPWYKRILGIGEPTPPTAPIIPAAMFPEGALALTFVGGRIMTTGTWAIDAAPAVGRIAVAGAGAPIAVAIIGMMPSRLNDSE